MKTFLAALILAIPFGSQSHAQDRSKPAATGPVRVFKLPDIQEETLAQGAKLAFMKVRRSELISLQLVLPFGGSAFDPKDKAGLAGLVAALMKEGATVEGKNLDGRNFAIATDKLGASVDVSVGSDSMVVTVFAIKKNFKKALRLAAGMLTSPQLPEKELTRLKQETLTSLQMQQQDPEHLTEKRLGERIFGVQHPYGYQPNASTINAVTGPSIAGFLKTDVRPGGAVFAVAGNIKNIAKVKKLVENNFKSFTAAMGAPAPGTLEVPPLPEFEDAEASADGSAAKEMVIDVIDVPGLPQSAIRAGNRSIDIHDPDIMPLRIMNSILGGASVISRLFKNLREDHKWTYGASSSLTAMKHGGWFEIETDVKTEATGPAVQEILKEMGRLQTELVPMDELDRVKNYVIGTFVLRQQKVQDLASEVGKIEEYGFPKDNLNTFRDRVLAVTPEDVQRVAKKHLRPQELKIVISGDASKIINDLKTIAPVRIITPNGPTQETGPVSPSAPAS